MEKEKIGFFRKLILVITDFRSYPYLVKHEKFYKSFLYLLKLVLILSLIFSINLIYDYSKVFKNLVNNYDEIVPEFELKNGTLNVYEKYSQKLNKNSYLIIDTDYKFDEFKATKDYSNLLLYDNVTLINSDKIIFKVGGEIQSILSFNELEGELSKDILHSEIIRIIDEKEYIVYIAVAILSIFIAYFMYTFGRIIFLTLIVLIICGIYGIHLNFKNYMKIAIYSYTLPLIFELL